MCDGGRLHVVERLNSGKFRLLLVNHGQFDTVGGKRQLTRNHWTLVGRPVAILAERRPLERLSKLLGAAHVHESAERARCANDRAWADAAVVYAAWR